MFVWNISINAILRVIVFAVAITNCFFSSADTMFGNWMKFLSNLAFLVPLQLSYELRMYTFSIIIAFVATVSFLWHACGIDMCLSEKLVTMDVEFSRWALLTALSYIVFGKEYHIIFPLNMALSVIFNNFDDWVPYIITGACYITAFIICIFTQRLVYDALDVLSSFCIGAFSLYLFENFNEHSYVHSLWHVLDAIALTLLLTCFENSRFHTFGFRVKSVPTFMKNSIQYSGLTQLEPSQKLKL